MLPLILIFFVTIMSNTSSDVIAGFVAFMSNHVFSLAGQTLPPWVWRESGPRDYHVFSIGILTKSCAFWLQPSYFMISYYTS